MANTGYNGTPGTAHNEWEDFEAEDLEAITVPFQLTDLSFTEHPVGCFPYFNQTPNHHHNQGHLQQIPSTLEGNRNFDQIYWQAQPTYPGMDPVVPNDRHISEIPLENASVEGSSHIMTANNPQGLLRCTYPSCTAKEEDKIFMGKSAKSAHKRHMDGHIKPHRCPHVECPRHTSGFARRDNFNNHLKTHQNEKKHRRSPAPSYSKSLGTRGGGISAGRRSLQRMSPRKRGKLVNFLLVCMELGFEVDEDEEYDAGGDGDEETEDGAD